jgi:hypothetical protein
LVAGFASKSKPDPDPYQSQNSGAVKVQNMELWRVENTNNEAWRLKMEP